MRLTDAVYLVAGSFIFVAVVTHTNIIRNLVDKIKGTKLGRSEWYPDFDYGYYQPITPETYSSVIMNQYAVALVYVTILTMEPCMSRTRTGAAENIGILNAYVMTEDTADEVARNVVVSL